jgi:tRNA (guanine37-N1)-methyltransferase
LERGVTFTVLSLFPEIVDGFFQNSIMAKAVERGVIAYRTVNIRDFAFDRHRTCDDAPFGGGAGMVLKPGPIARALDSVGSAGVHTVYPSPAGRLLTQEHARELAEEEELVFICGRYEGVDQRVIDMYVDEEISIGDYVISSGEIAALVVIDAVYRLVDGVIRAESLEQESFEEGLLEYPHYTRPDTFRGLRVPSILKSGHHRLIERWRRQQQMRKTEVFRPDLLIDN